MSSLSKGVRGGTLGGESLCITCRNCVRVQGSRISQTIVYCNEISYASNGPLPFEAFECSKYDDVRLPSKHDMEKLAWILRTDPKQKGQLGFVSPKKRREEMGDNWDLPSILSDSVASPQIAVKSEEGIK